MLWPTRRSPRRPSDYSPGCANTGLVRGGLNGALLPRWGLTLLLSMVIPEKGYRARSPTI
jgi:hypothetical protein